MKKNIGYIYITRGKQSITRHIYLTSNKKTGLFTLTFSTDLDDSDYRGSIRRYLSKFFDAVSIEKKREGGWNWYKDIYRMRILFSPVMAKDIDKKLNEINDKWFDARGYDNDKDIIKNAKAYINIDKKVVDLLDEEMVKRL